MAWMMAIRGMPPYDSGPVLIFRASARTSKLEMAVIMLVSVSILLSLSGIVEASSKTSVMLGRSEPFL